MENKCGNILENLNKQVSIAEQNVAEALERLGSIEVHIHTEIDKIKALVSKIKGPADLANKLIEIVDALAGIQKMVGEIEDINVEQEDSLGTGEWMDNIGFDIMDEVSMYRGGRVRPGQLIERMEAKGYDGGQVRAAMDYLMGQGKIIVDDYLGVYLPGDVERNILSDDLNYF